MRYGTSSSAAAAAADTDCVLFAVEVIGLVASALGADAFLAASELTSS